MAEEREEVDLGRRIRAARALSGLLAPELAQRLGVHPDTLRKYERGLRIPSADQLEALAAASNVPLEFFTVDLRALSDPPAVIVAELSAIQDRLARIEAELGIQRRRSRGA
jgi:transcriptional regulator with XRE-family HTH domain